jgi:hypothetical protein
MRHGRHVHVWRELLLQCEVPRRDLRSGEARSAEHDSVCGGSDGMWLPSSSSRVVRARTQPDPRATLRRRRTPPPSSARPMFRARRRTGDPCPSAPEPEVFSQLAAPRPSEKPSPTIRLLLCALLCRDRLQVQAGVFAAGHRCASAAKKPLETRTCSSSMEWPKPKAHGQSETRRER